MLRRYSRGFFGLQVRFAARVADRLGLPLAESLERFTTLPLSLEFGDAAAAEEFGARLRKEDALEVAWDLYARRHPGEWEDLGQERHSHRLFGCFYYGLQDGTVLRQHFIKNARPGESVLGRESERLRRSELVAMLRHVREHAPEARIVQGNSWLYNLEAYRRLYPPAYTQDMAATPYDEYRYLALWGQFYDRDWEPRPGPAATLLAGAERVADAEDVLVCFPLKVLRPSCAIGEFFRFYGVG